MISKGVADEKEFDSYNTPKETAVEDVAEADIPEAVAEEMVNAESAETVESAESPEEEQLPPYEHRIRLVNAGFDRKALQPVVEELLNCEIR